MQKNEGLELAHEIIKVLKIKALAGCKTKKWENIENGYGKPFAHDINRLIKKAQKFLAENSPDKK